MSICKRSTAAWAGAIALSIAEPAAAHTGTGLAGGFVSGFLHPLVGVDHLLAMVCVGLWGAVLGRPLIHVLPVVFPAVMVAGAVMAMFGVTLPPAETGIATSVLVLGICVASSIKAPTWVASLIVATFAVFHGYTHGSELPSAADPFGYSAGFVIATGLLHLFGIAIGSLNRWRRGAGAIRIMGWGIAAVGTYFLAIALTAAIRSGTVGLAGSWTGLLIALPCLPIFVAATWLMKSDRSIVIKIAASWLVAIAVLAATLPFLSVTPGYLPDHME